MKIRWEITYKTLSVLGSGSYYVLKKCLYLFLLIEKVDVPCWGKDLELHLYVSVHVPDHARTHTHNAQFCYLLTHTQICWRFSRWHWTVDIIFCTKLAPLNSLDSLAGKPGESSSRSSSWRLDLVTTPFIPVAPTFSPGHQFLFELCQEPSS